MRWLRDAGWLVAICLGVGLLTSWLPRAKKLPDPQDTKASIDKMRAEWQEKQAKRELAVTKVKTDGTLETLRLVGRAYLRRTAWAKAPPTEADFAEVVDLWRSRRDEQPFVIVWGVDLTSIPDGTGTLLAWERTPDKNGDRCVLMADAKTAKVVSADEFEKLPRAK